MDPIQPKHSSSTYMHEHTDSSILSEVESLSDSEWLDVASGRESDTDSIYSSRGTDHGRTSSCSRSRRSSISIGSSGEEDVDAWEGLIEDSVDEGLVPDTVRLSSSAVAFHQGLFTTSPDEDTGDPTEERRVKEGLDQSMISTLSSSRSSSLHASTVINPPRDLRLSFPDPITSSHEELSNSSYEDILSLVPGPDPVIDADVHLTEPEATADMSHRAESPSSAPITNDAVSAVLDSDLIITLYGLPNSHKWSLTSKLLEKAVRGARLTIATPLEQIVGPVRQLHIEGGTNRSMFFPRIITVTDMTDSTEDNKDPFTKVSTNCPSLAIVFLPFSPLQLPEHAAYLPILVPAPCALDSVQTEDAILNSAQETWNLFDVPRDRVLRLSHFGPSVVNADVIESLPPYRAYRTFDRVLSRGRKKSIKGLVNSPHAFTLFTVVSLVIGVVVGSTFRGTVSTVVTPTPVTTAIVPAASPPSLWELLRPVINHSCGSLPAKTEPTVIPIHSSLKGLALSIFNPDSASLSIAEEIPTSGFRGMSSLSEKLRHSKDIILHPTSSHAFDGRTKSLSVVPSATSSAPHVEDVEPTPSSSALTTSTFGLSFLGDSLPKVVDAYTPAVLAAVNADMQDIIEALDSLVQAISRQAHVMLAQTNAIIQYSAAHVEHFNQDLEAIRGTLTARHERAQRRARELKDHGAKWLHEAGEALMNRASRASGKAKEITVDIEQIWAETNIFREKWEGCKTRGVQRRAGRETWRNCWDKGKQCRDRSKKCTTGGRWLSRSHYY